MQNYSMNICSYHPESREEAYSDDSPDDPSDGDGSQYFEIDISLPFSSTDATPTSDEDDSEDEFDLSLSICSSNPTSPNQCISPADNLFCHGQLLSLQLSPTPLDDIASPQSSSSGIKTQFPNLLKTAAKLKIPFSGFKKSAKLGSDFQTPCSEYGTDMDSPMPRQNRFLAVKFKVVDVPLVSLFTRDKSKGSKRDFNNNQGFQKKSEDSDDEVRQTCSNMDRDKKRAKEIVQKYVDKIKLLCVKISQRYNEKIRFRYLENPSIRNGVKNGGSQSSGRSEKHIPFSDFSGNQKMVYNHLGKGKQQPSDAQQKLPKYNMNSEKTLMEIQSSIQGAIAHCKRSNSNGDASKCPKSRCWAES